MEFCLLLCTSADEHFMKIGSSKKSLGSWVERGEGGCAIPDNAQKQNVVRIAAENLERFPS
jgi:hypothetical protein